jgi:hypothetical protein
LNFEKNHINIIKGWLKGTPLLYHYTWGLFTRDLEAQYGKVWEHDYFSQLTRIKQLDDIEYYNLEF